MKPHRTPLVRTRLLIISTASIVILVVIFAYTLSTSSTGNYAKDIAKPLEQTLLNNGAVKKCETGDGGRGMDNREPWYNVYFELPADRSKAIELINKIATDNGYRLTHANPANRGHLGAVADIYLDNWYFDNTSKLNPYKDLNEGQIELSFALYNDEKIELSHLSCGTERPAVVNNDANRTAITISVNLPGYRP